MIWLHTSLIANLVISAIVAFIASRKGRSGAGWFFAALFVGFFFNANILLLILVLVSSDLGEERARQSQEHAWRRRHQEEFEQERKINRHFRDHVTRRLDRQDEVMKLPPLEPRETAEETHQIETVPLLGDGQWYLVIDGKEEGPFPETEVIRMLRQGGITGENYAWSEGMREWIRTGKIANFTAHC